MLKKILNFLESAGACQEIDIRSFRCGDEMSYQRQRNFHFGRERNGQQATYIAEQEGHGDYSIARVMNGKKDYLQSEHHKMWYDFPDGSHEHDSRDGSWTKGRATMRSLSSAYEVIFAAEMRELSQLSPPANMETLNISSTVFDEARKLIEGAFQPSNILEQEAKALNGNDTETLTEDHPDYHLLQKFRDLGIE